MRVLFLIICFFSLFKLDAQITSFEGRVTNSNVSNNYRFKLLFIQDKKVVDSTITNDGGFYKIKLQSGIYSIKIIQDGYIPQIVDYVDVFNSVSLLNLTLKLSYIPKPQYSNPNIYKKTYPADTARRTIVYDTSKKVETYFEEVKVYAKAEKVKMLSSSYSSKSYSSSKKSKKSKRSKRVKTLKLKKTKHLKIQPKSEAPSVEDKKVTAPYLHRSSESKAVISHDFGDVSSTAAGQVTAGHWRDLDHWKDWYFLNNKPDIIGYQNTWKMYPIDKLELSILSKDEKALSFTKVQLLNSRDSLVWETYTDINGKAFFWPNVFAQSASEKHYKLKVGEGKVQQTFKQVDDYFNSYKSIKTTLESPKQQQIEIGFMVDATGSMGDEIKFLQNELIDVISRVKKDRPCIDIYTGAVFYKDYGDDYLTSILPMSNNPSNTISFIANKYAGGGGDFPEAVDKGLEASITQLNWSNLPNTKILFILLDAPPHENENNKLLIQKYTAEAAKLGIRIVPIAASGINKSTEFLLKYMSVITNGEYVYITDDSRIGNAHLLPTGGRSTVEKLNDILVNIIKDYSKSDCPTQEPPLKIELNDSLSNLQVLDSISQKQQRELIIGNNFEFKYYPNPAVNYVFIKWKGEVKSITLTSMNGQTLLHQELNNLSELSIDLSSLSSGIYFITLNNSNESVTGRLVVMH